MYNRIGDSMKLFKILLSLILLISLSSCASNSVNEDLYYDFVEAYGASGALSNYHNNASSILSIDEQFTYEVQTSSDYVDGNARIDSTTYIDNENMGTSSIYIVDGNIYYDNIDGSKTYTTFDSDLSNMNDLFFELNDIKSISTNSNGFDVVLSDEACEDLLIQNGLDYIEVVDLNNELKLEIENGLLYSQFLTIDYTLSNGDSEYSGSYEYQSSYTNINENNLILPDDYSLYINLDDLQEDMTLEEFKLALIQQLGYTVDEYGQYVLDFNDNETYIFDFNNNLFTYIRGQSAYTYNWASNIGAYNACTYDFTNAINAGTCSDTEQEMIEEAKVSYLTELSFIGISEMPKN